MDIKLTQHIDTVNADEWNQITGQNDPFLQHAFLLALEKSLSVCRETGWQPHHLLVYSDQQLIAVMPLYLNFTLKVNMFSITFGPIPIITTNTLITQNG